MHFSVERLYLSASNNLTTTYLIIGSIESVHNNNNHKNIDLMV